MPFWFAGLGPLAPRGPKGPTASPTALSDRETHTDTQAAPVKAGLFKVLGVLSKTIGILAVILGTKLVAKKLSNTRTARRIVSKRLEQGAERFGGAAVVVSGDMHLDGALKTQLADKPLTPETLRLRFNELPLVVSKEQPNHSHANSARHRSDASALMVRYAALVGLHPYFYQCSRADERSQRDGSKDFFWAKDLNVKTKDHNPPQNSLLAIVDVDYYINMNEFLLDEFKPTLLYTLQPTHVSRQQGEYAYTFNSRNEVVYSVTGGGKYTHEVWNYSTDCLLIKRCWLGIPVRAATFFVDRKRVDDDHELVLLTPVARWGFGTAWMSSWLEGRDLQRLQPVVGRFTRMVVQTKDGLYTSTGTVDGYASARILSVDDDALAHITSNSKHDLTMPQAQAFTDGEKPAAAVLVSFHRQYSMEHSAHKPPVVFPLQEAIHSYTFSPENYDPAAKTPMVPFMSPLLHEAYVAAATLDNEIRAVKNRITDVKSDTLTMTHFIDKAMREFVELFLPQEQVLVPVMYDEVYDHQSRPTQRRILDAMQGTDPSARVSSFLKTEAYGDPKDPRLISTLTGATKTHYSSFLYALSDHLKTVDWYAFSRSPADIAQTVADICASAKGHVVNSDLSRFDGRISNLLRELEQRVLVRAFMPCFTEELLKLHRLQIGATAYTRQGVKYDTGFARLSGSPETSAFNSIDNAFMAFLTFRKTLVNGAYMDKEQAYAALGIYGGDDGLTADISTTVYVKTCTSLGQSLTAEEIPKGQLGVKFLARIYSPGVWFGNLTSCCDIPRQLKKFHVTPVLAGNVGPTDKLVEKARSFYLSDKNTPFIGPFVRKVVEIYGGVPDIDPKLSSISNWNSRLNANEQYPNDAEEWMHEYAASALDDADEKSLQQFLDSCTELKDLLSPPLLRDPPEPSISAPVVINGITHKPAVKTQSVQKMKVDWKNKKQNNWTAKPKLGRPLANVARSIDKSQFGKRKLHDKPSQECKSA